MATDHQREEEGTVQRRKRHSDILRPFAVGGLVVATFQCLAAAAGSDDRSSLEALVRESTVIVDGTVTKIGATTVPALAVGPRTVVVRLDGVLHGPKFLNNQVGKEVTLQLRPAKDPRTPRSPVSVGEGAIFFSRGLVLGGGVALQEVGRLRRPNLPDPPRSIAATLARIADEDLRQRLTKADLVAVATVTALKPPAQPLTALSLTEHEPQLRDATLKVERRLKGKAGVEIVLRFPSSIDVAWVHVPKASPAQEGIWILESEPKSQVYRAPGRLDFQPKDQLQRVLRLLKGSK